MLRHKKGCPEYKKQAFRQHTVNNQKTCRNCKPKHSPASQNKQEAPSGIMGRRATDVNHWPSLLPRSYRRKLAHWAKCLQLGVSQVASECMSGLNGLNWVYLLLNLLLKTGSSSASSESRTKSQKVIVQTCIT